MGKGIRLKWLDFGSDPDHHADCPFKTTAIILQFISEFDEIFRLALHW